MSDEGLEKKRAPGLPPKAKRTPSGEINSPTETSPGGDKGGSNKKGERLTREQAAEEIKRLRKEIRENREELAQRRVAVEQAQDEVSRLRDNCIALPEARKLTYKALRKGRALQYLATLFEGSSFSYGAKRTGMLQLARNAAGSGVFAYRNLLGVSPGTTPYNDAQLILLRKEQLVLMAENERLLQQVKQLQQYETWRPTREFGGVRIWSR
eukprot:GHVU01019210.1.p2 GENE.GHVU01019210.1~~GHVU01019210.1.p2  ORF type:complete len:211 (-),score=31.12 GHVU01019210.1:1966-2598(-)